MGVYNAPRVVCAWGKLGIGVRVGGSVGGMGVNVDGREVGLVSGKGVGVVNGREVGVNRLTGVSMGAGVFVDAHETRMIARTMVMRGVLIFILRLD